jgi:subtilisin family serine protease
MNTAVQDAWNAGLVIVAAAGNNGSTSLFYPAAYANVVSVGAFDQDHGRASFSNYGTWVDISAPGNVIMSSYPGALYAWMNGTSMATPHVAGAVALVWSHRGVAVAGNTNADIVNILLQSADGQGVAGVRLDSWTINGGLNLHAAMSVGLSNQAPVANAGPNQTVIDSDGSGSENVTLDGSASSDADGTIVSYAWSEGATSIGSGAILTHSFAIGSHVVTLTVTDNGGATATDTVTVTVQSATDTVAITKATYNSRSKALTVEAASTGAPTAVLTAWNNSNPSSPVSLGVLTYNSTKNKYVKTFSIPSKPTSVKVTSSLGGSSVSAVGGK